MGKTLLQKVWDLHTVRTLPSGQTQLFVGLHLIHEVTTPQAFEALLAEGFLQRVGDAYLWSDAPAPQFRVRPRTRDRH